MNWPWTSRGRLDDALAQVAYLRGEVAKLTDALTRISRREAGMAEVPREPRPPFEPMPRSLREYIEGFLSTSLQKTMRDQGIRRHAAGESWADIEAAITAEERTTS